MRANTPPKKHHGSPSYISPRSVRMNEKVLSYGDVVLYQQDMLALNPRGWLTDNIINFALHYIFESSSEVAKQKTLIIATGVTEIIKFVPCDDQVMNQLGLSSEKYMFFPVSDNKNPSLIGGGTHWTLLVYDPRRKAFYFFDCQRTRGIDPDIYHIVQQLSQIMKLEDTINVHTPSCPQMPISGDCGLYVIEYIRAILKQLCIDENEDPYVFEFTSNYISNSRADWIRIISQLATAQQNNQ